MTGDQQRTWVINAADVLHRSNAIDSYGPPIGEYLAREAPQTGAPASTPRLAAKALLPTGDHMHEQGLYIQLLPDCLAPSPTDRDAHHGLGLPHEGDAVMIAGEHVMFLAADEGTSRFAVETTQLWGAPLIGEGCGAARWDPDSVTALDPSYVGLEDADAEAIYTAWRLLIDLANDCGRRR